MRRLLALCLLLIPALIFAAVYVKQDNEGNLQYSDTPEPGSKTTSIPNVSGTTSIQTQTAPMVPENGTKLISPVAAEKEYNRFQISSPKEQENIQNQPAVNVTFDIDPALQTGNKIQLFVDGKPWGDPISATSISIPLQERGQHSVSASILSSNNQVLKQSQTVTFFVHRNSVITSPAAKAAP